MRPIVFSAFSALAIALGAAAPSAHAAAPLPPLPDPNAPSPTPAPQAGQAPQAAQPPAATSPDRAAHPLHPLTTIEHARRGVVAIETNNTFLGVGTVLAGDGRVLTSLSGLRGVDEATIRYADGSSARAKIGHRDKAWDLALLVPQSGRWLDGLMASDGDAGQAAVAFLGRGPKALAALPIALKSRQDVNARTGESLPGALDFDLRGATPLAGAPVLDTRGNVLGVLVLACRAPVAPQPPANGWPPATAQAPQAPPANAAANAAGACAPIAVGAPVAAIRNFLQHTPETAIAPAPWLGIRGESDASGPVHGVRVLAVASGSPAEKGGLKVGAERTKNDLIIAVDGVPVDSPEKLADAIAKHAVGDNVKLLVYSGTFRETTITLRAAPSS